MTSRFACRWPLSTALILSLAQGGLTPPVAAASEPAATEAEAAPEAAPEAPTELPAAADETPEALSAAAVEAFGAQRYDEAAALFRRAYNLDPEPNYLFNIGRVYEEKGDLELAVQHYQDFVKQPGVDLGAREIAVARLKVLRETLRALADEEQAKKATAAPAPVPQANPAAQPVDARALSRRRQLRLAGYSLLGVGGAGLIIGTVFGALAVAKSRDSQRAQLVDQKLALRQEARGRAAVSDGLLITGGVLAAAGLTMVLVTLRRPRASASAQAHRHGLAPAVAPGQAALVWSGQF